MTTIVFNATDFRAMYPAYSNQTVFTDSILQLYWDTATAYVSDQTGGCYVYGFKLGQQTLALNLMTAHLAYINALTSTGQAGGVMTGATIDKISVTLQPPPSSNNWQFWLNQSPYGQQLLALLSNAAVGGFYFGGYPTVNTMRR